MDYRLELLSDEKFEALIHIICQNILGIEVISFAPIKDGGRDGKNPMELPQDTIENDALV
ncbi:hypothetical protein [Catalinimonas niigatensis]|uniref:hypothetical protein n=1 Tax=Catalinimonas niigatensis TaxID=1397264 RepID=UPI0026668032|nr:hypothetical protein [Catalinimonas niigatensis]WPP48453.1 hypothetical protein PZB72_17410 [Catalinimonas niigatensis]